VPADPEAPLSDEEAHRLLSPIMRAAMPVLLAVSGGPDSVALMRLSARLGGRAGEIEAATVDHGLRPHSREEAERVGAWARQCGLAHSVLRWEGPKPGTRIQERARAARYALLCARARRIGASSLVTAHTLDDQAETVLMRIARGTGLSGLAAMRPCSRRDGLVQARPFLGVPKARLVATCRARDWPFVEDPSNVDPRFARARWRGLAAALAAEGLTAGRLAKLADRAALAEEALAAKADEAYRKAAARSAEGVVLDMALLAGSEPREIALRLLMRAIAELNAGTGGAPIRLARVESVLAALANAYAARDRLTRTLGGAILTFDGEQRLVCAREGERRRGRQREGGGESAGSAKRSRARLAKKGNPDASLALV